MFKTKTQQRCSKIFLVLTLSVQVYKTHTRWLMYQWICLKNQNVQLKAFTEFLCSSFFPLFPPSIFQVEEKACVPGLYSHCVAHSLMKQPSPIKLAGDNNIYNLHLVKQLYSKGLHVNVNNFKVTSKMHASLYETDLFDNYGIKTNKRVHADSAKYRQRQLQFCYLNYNLKNIFIQEPFTFFDNFLKGTAELFMFLCTK